MTELPVERDRRPVNPAEQKRQQGMEMSPRRAPQPIQRPNAPQAGKAQRMQGPAQRVPAQRQPLNNGRPADRRPEQRPVQRPTPAQRMPEQRPAVQKAPVQKPAVQKAQLPAVQRAPRNPARNVQKRSLPAERPARRAVQPAENRPVQRAPQQARKPVQKAPEVQKQEAPKIPVRPFIIFGIVMVFVSVLAYFAFFLISESSKIKRKVTVEAGSSANFDMFLDGMPKYPQYLSTNLDFTTVDYMRPQSVFFVITLYGIDHNCELIVADTTPPTGEAVTQELMSVDQIPDAEKCVTNIKDITPVTVTWADKPDISAGGEYVAAAKLTDAAGNESLVNVPLSVTRDSVAPVISGYRDISIIKGETISYRTGITVTDNYDKNPRLEIDTSNVKLDKPGDYEAIYRAIDYTGNKTEVTIKVKIKQKPKDYVEPKVVYDQAKKVLETLIEPGMNDMEKALQIVWWVRYNVRFNVRIKPKSWTEAAYNAFRERRGNCLSCASCVKAMLDVEGIENMFVTRWPYKVAKHYWNYVKIDGQWYHCDATWRQNYSSYFFMYTTKELLRFWHDGWNGFEFDEKKYPESATASVQKKIDYKNHKIKS